MPAVFSYDAQTGPQYVDLNGIAAGFGIISVPVDGFLPGDQVQTVGLTITGTGLATIQLAVDTVIRTGGYYEWTASDAIDAHFTVTNAQIAAIAAATACQYTVVIMVLRSGAQQLREVQTGTISARAAVPAPPLIVNAITLAGGPVTGNVGSQTQLTATAFDGLGNALPLATIAWSSSNTNVASVDATGKVTLLIPGTATITASSQGVATSTTATCNDASFLTPTDKQVSAYSASQTKWLPTTLTAAYLAITAGALAVGGGWPGGATELAPGAAGGYVRSNGAAFVRQSGVPASDVTAGTFGAGAYVFPSSLTVTSGFTVSAGTSALQAVTATTVNASGGFTGTLTGNASTATALATGRTISITGDLAYTSPLFDGSGNVTAAGTLATVNATVGTFGGSTAIPVFTVNAKGLITAASTAVVIAPAGTLTGATLASNVLASSLTSVGVLASPHMTSAVIDSGGLAITAGTLAAQAVTATTLQMTGALTVTNAGASSVAVGPTGATNPVWQIDASTGSQAAGLKLTGAIAAGTVALAVISSGANANLKIDALGAGTLTLGGTSTGNVILGTSVNVTSAGAVSGVTTLATSSTINSQTISAAANFTGSVTVANGFTVSAGVAALQAMTATTATFAGNVIWSSNNAFDIGDAGGAHQPRDLWLARNATIGGTLGITGLATLASLVVDGSTVNPAGLNAKFRTDAPILTESKYALYDAGGGVDGKYWDIVGITGSLAFRAVNDAWNAASNYLQVSRSGTTINSVSVAGNFLAASDNAADLGANGGSRFRDFFLARNATIGGTTTHVGVVGIGASAAAAALSITLGVTASASAARSVNITNSLTAAANSDTLSGIRIAPTYSIGGFAGVVGIGLDITDITGASTNIALRTGAGLVQFGGAVGVNVLGRADSLLAIGGSLSASGGTARAMYAFSTLSAAANNDVLTSIRVDPNFGNAGAFTGLTTRALFLGSYTVPTNTTTAFYVDIGALTATGATTATALNIANVSGATSNFAIKTGTGVVSFGDALIWGTDNSFDIGLIGANRARDLFLARNFIGGGTISASGATGGITLRPGVTNNGCALDSPQVNLANLATLVISPNTNICTVTISANATGDLAIVALKGGANTVSVLASTGTWGTALGAANNYNVYYDAGSTSYKIENRSGGICGFTFTRMGNVPNI